MKLNLIALGVLLAAAGAARADLTFTPSATYTTADSRKNSDNEIGYNLSLGYRFSPAIAVELVHGRTESTLHGGTKKHSISQILASGQSLDTSDSRLGLDAYYAFMPENKLSPYVLLGAGEARYKTHAPKVMPNGSRNYTENYADPYVNGAIGAFYRINDSISLRGEYRLVFQTDEALYDNMALLGVQFATGAAAVAAVVAPQPEPEQAPVEQQAVVVAPVDTDADGVADASDKCPSTPAGVQVDGNGCPFDDDADGVPNYLDKCSGTSAGVVVDEKGCDKTLVEAISQELKINFDSSKAVVKDEYKAEVEKVAALMKQYPSTHVEIQGHTDSSGKKASNDKLSQDRANAVKLVLVTDFAIDATRVTATGYGSAQPVADNKTVDGRAQNRRVIAIVSGEAKKTIRKKK